MRLLSRLFLATIMALGIAANSRSAADAPRNVIFDTDMGGDCDDVGALFLLHGAVERGKARLLATIGCTSSEAIAPCLDAINTWFGRAEIPVGTLKDPGFLDGRGFPEEIVRCFPHRSPASAHYPDALALYRQVLAAQPDGSVIIVAVGPLRNLANLLRSGPDAATPLTGPALIARKVKLLHVMGGHYPPQAKQKDAEYNFQKDPVSAAMICGKWPTPILFNGEGGSTSSGRRVTYEMPEHNPMTMAYAAYPGVGFAGDRLSWDPVSCLVAVQGADPWYEVVGNGRNLVDEGTGMNTWQPGGEQRHSYLVLRKGMKAAVEEALEDLMVAGRGRPADLTFNTAYYAQSGMAQITASGAADATVAAIKTFDRDEKSAWLEKAATSWIQCRYADGRKNRVTSYAVVCREMGRLPRTLELILAGTIISVIIALPAGTFAAVRAGGAFDRVASSLAALLQAVPVFVLGTLLILLLAQTLRWMPAGGYVPLAEDPARHFLLLLLLLLNFGSNCVLRINSCHRAFSLGGIIFCWLC